MSGCGCGEAAERLEKTSLKKLLMINGVMFLIEAWVGWWGESTGLLADSLDMFADASVYGLAFYASGRSSKLQSGAATGSGWIQIALGVGVLAEVVRRFLFGSEPVSVAMIRQLLYRNVALDDPRDAHRVESLSLRHTGIGDGREGVNAFHEKRDPAFRARASDMPPFYDEWVR